MLVSIYRVETPRGGCGPYTREYEHALGDMFAEHRSGSHEGPLQDALLGRIDPAEHCGFATRDHLEVWFDGWLPLLATNGFVGTRYAVPIHTVRFGKAQALFRRGDRWPVETFPLS